MKKLGGIPALVILVILCAFPASAGAATTTTTYVGTINGDLSTEFSFDVKKVNSERTVKNVQFTGLPVFCDDGQSTTTNGSVPVRAPVDDDGRFIGTGYREGGQGGITLAHLRGEFRQRRSLAAGRFSVTLRFFGGMECSSGFVDWAADRVEEPDQ